jgi:DNA/RNA-binding protein KIN17
VHWIDRDPKTLERQAQLESRQRSDLDDEERARLLIASQIAAGSSSLEEDNEECLEENKLERSENMPKIGISLNVNLGDKSRGILGKLGSSVFSVEDEAVAPNDKTIRNEKAVPIIQQIRQEDERRRERELDSMDRRERLDYWLQEGLCVKIINKVVGVGKYYKQKGAVVRVLDRYVADVEVSGLAVLRLDQDDLETVLPKVDTSELSLTRVRDSSSFSSHLCVLVGWESSYDCERSRSRSASITVSYK